VCGLGFLRHSLGKIYKGELRIAENFCQGGDNHVSQKTIAVIRRRAAV
jgi:hypothetical protein